MADRIDELFNPERLRRHWEAPSAPVPEPAVPEDPSVPVRAQYQALLDSLDQRYPGAAALRFPLETLSGLIDAAFPTEGGGADPKQRGAIVAALENLEETLWALDVTRVRR